MIDAYNATYASVSYVSQTTSLSLSVQQNQTAKDSASSSASSDDDFSFSLGYTSTTTVETYSLLVVQELGNSNNINDNTAQQGQDEKSALATVLEGPSDPYNPLESASPTISSALEIVKDALDALQGGDDDDGGDDDGDDHDNGNKYGHAVRDNNHGHTKNDIQVAYSVAQFEVTTSTTQYSLSV